MRSPGIMKKRKVFVLIVIMCLFFSSVLSLALFSNVYAPSPPQYDKDGNMIVTGGKTVLIKTDGAIHTHSGNIIVNESSTLIIRNSTFKINPDIKHPYTITVTDNSKLVIEDTLFTIDTNAIQATYFLQFDIMDSTIEILNSSMVMPGTFNLTDSSFKAVNSRIEELSIGYGSPAQIFNSSNVYYEDCIVDDFKLNNPIRLLEDSEFIAINTFFDLDYDTRKMIVANSSHAELYGITINPGLFNNRPIDILHSPCWANIYRWLVVAATDSLNVPIGQTRIEVRNATNDYSPIPEDYILDYLGKDSGDYNYTNSSGQAILPLISDNLTYNSMPNAIFKGNYKLMAYKNSYTTTSKVGLSAYPVLSKGGNNPNATLIFNEIILPDNNPYYKSTSSDIVITNTKGKIENSIYQKPQGGVVDLSFGQQGNIIVNGTASGGGGELEVISTKLGIEQDKDNRYYILIEENGNINLNKKSAIKDGSVSPGKYPINIYIRDSATMMLSKNSKLRNIGSLSLDANSQLTLDNSQIHGKLVYGNGINQNLKLTCINNSQLNISSLSVKNAELFFENSNVSVNTKPIFKHVSMNATNTTFNLKQKLTFSQNSKVYLTNVSRPDYSNITAKDTSEVEISWWLTVVVEDQQGNPLKDATVYIERYEIDNNELKRVPYKQGNTDAKGRFTEDVFAGRITSSGATIGGLLGNYYVYADYFGTKSDSSSLTRSRQGGGNVNVYGKNQKVIIVIPGKPDLTIGNISTTPSPGYKNQETNISAEITNVGSFAAFNVEVEFWDLENNMKLGAEKIAHLNASKSSGSTQDISVGHIFNDEGTYEVTVIVDPYQNITEANETNNDKFMDIDIVSLDKADLIIEVGSITTNPQSPIPQNSIVTVSATIKNVGTVIAQNFKVRFIAHYEKKDIILGEDQTIFGLGPNSDQDIDTEDFEWKVEELTKLDEFIEIEVIVDVDNVVDEFNEDNNNLSKPITIVVGPDLIVSGITFSKETPITRETNFDIYANIKNVGQSDSPSFSVEFYYNALDTPLGKPVTSMGLEIGNTTTVVFKVEGGMPKQLFSVATTYTIFVKVDPDNEITEINETNNTDNIELTLKTKVDFEINNEDISFDVEEADNGKDFKIFARVTNVGQTDSVSYIVRFYLGDPDKPATFPRQIGTDFEQLKGLEAGKSETFVLTLSLEVGGNYLISVQIVYTPDEEKKNNNKAINSIYVKYKADLFVKEIKTDKDEEEEQPLVNTEIIITYIIGNSGDTPAQNFIVELWDGLPGATGSIKLENSTHIFLLKGGDPYTYEYKWQPMTPGFHQIYVRLDPGFKVPEKDENNNTHFITITIARTAPDLRILESDIKIMVSRDNLNGDGKEDIAAIVMKNGESFWVNVKIANIGDDLASDFNVNIYLNGFETLLETINIVELPNLNNSGNDSNNESKSDINKISIDTELKKITKNMVGKEHQIIVVLDPENRINDSETSNNINSSQKFRIVRPDITISSFQMQDENGNFIVDGGKIIGEAKKGETVSVLLTVDNKGTEEATVSVNILINDEFKKASDTLLIEKDKNQQFTLKLEINQDSDFTITAEANGLYGEPGPGEGIPVKTPFIASIPLEKGSKEEENGIITIGLFPYDIFVIIIIIVIICAIAGFIVYLKKKREKMAECSECGVLIPIDATECPKCGAEFSDEIECGECGALMKVTDTTCPACGAVFTKEEGEGEEEGEEEELSGLGAPGLGPTPKPSKGKPAKPEKPKGAPKPRAPAAKPKPQAPVAPPAPAGAVKPEELEEEEEKAECYRCGAIVPLSASMCPECGAEFE